MSGPPAAGLQLGIVVACYPEGNAVDIILPDSGSRLSNVQVMFLGSDSTGTVDLPDPGLPADDTRWLLTNNPARTIYGIVGSYKGHPVCLGFLLPQVNQMTFKQLNRRIVRHASDVYTTTDKSGNTELYHPSGTYLRIGTTPAHEDLTGLDFDALWKITKNTATAVYVHLTVANAGVVKATLEIDPSGNVALVNQGTLNATVTGNMTVTANQISLNGVTIDSSGNVNSPATVTATTDVVGGGKHLKTHTHSDPQGGNTGPPN